LDYYNTPHNYLDQEQAKYGIEHTKGQLAVLEQLFGMTTTEMVQRLKDGRLAAQVGAGR
jgi:hypothetical protein